MSENPQPVDEQPVDEQPVDEQPVDEQPVDEQPVDEQPVDEPAAAVAPPEPPDPSVAPGDPRVAAAVQRLEVLGDSPPDEHVEVYEHVHRVLQETLGDAQPDRSDGG